MQRYLFAALAGFARDSINRGGRRGRLGAQ